LQHIEKRENKMGTVKCKPEKGPSKSPKPQIGRPIENINSSGGGKKRGCR